MNAKRSPLPESGVMTPARIDGAASRIRLRFARATSNATALLGDRSNAWETLRVRIEAIAAATHLRPTTLNCGVPTSRLMLTLANAKHHAERAHDLAAALLAVAESIETEDASAEAIAADLAGIVEDCVFLLSAVEENAELIAA